MAITGDEKDLSIPIRSFIKYFNTIKPFHTKILEVLEQYNFLDALAVLVDEDLFSDYTLANLPLCAPVDLGTEFDEGFTFIKNFVIVGFDDPLNQVFVDDDETAEIAIGDFIFLNASVSALRPIKTEVTGVAYNGGLDRTEIDVTLDIQTGVNDDFTRVGTEYCNLFTTIVGGFGELFDDDKIIVTAPIASNDGNSTIVVSGNRSYDQRFQIKSIPNTSTVLIEGDITDVIDPDPDGAPTDGKHAFFRITPRRTYPILSCTATSFNVGGDKAAEILANKEMDVLGTGPNDGRYSIISATFDGLTDETTILVSSSQIIDPLFCDGVACVERATRNTGFYSVDSAVFNGIDTLITVNISTPFPLTDATEAGNHGSLLVRTGLTPRRVVTVNGEHTRLDKQFTIPNTFEDPLRQLTIVGQDETNYDNSPITEGSFVGGAGYAISDTITLIDGTIVTVIAEGGGVVTEFSITTATTTPFALGTLLGESSTSGGGSGFSLSPLEDNLEPLDGLVGADYEFDVTKAGPDWIPFPTEITITEDIDYTVKTTVYNASADQTTICLIGDLPSTIVGADLLMKGHFGAPGFDGVGDTDDPKEMHLFTSFSENLLVELIDAILLTPPPTPTPLPTPSPTISVTPSVTPTNTVTPTVTPTLTPTLTPTKTAGVTPTPSPTISITPTITVTISITPSVTPTITVTPTISITPTSTVTPTVTATITPTVTPQPTVTPTATPTSTGTPTPSPTISFTPTPTVTSNPTPTPTVTPTVTPSPVVGGDGFGMGGNPPATVFTIQSFPFSNPFTTATDIGDLFAGQRSGYGMASLVDGYQAGGAFGGGVGIDRFPFSVPFATATDIGDLTTGRGTHAGAQSSTDGYVAGGFTVITVEKFPFSSPFTTASDVGDLTIAVNSVSGAHSSDDGYTLGGNDPSLVIVSTIERYPFSAPFATATDIGDLLDNNRANASGSSSTDGFKAGGVTAAPLVVAQVEKFPFSSPFTLTTDVGDLDVAVVSSAGVSSSIDGHVLSGGPAPTVEEGIRRYPFNSSFTASSNIGDIAIATTLIMGTEST